MIREKILPLGLNTAMCCIGTELAPCWSFRTPTADWHAFTLKLLVQKVKAFATAEDAEILESEIDLIQIEETDLELFASQDEALLLELENNNTARSAEEDSE